MPDNLVGRSRIKGTSCCLFLLLFIKHIKAALLHALLHHAQVHSTLLKKICETQGKGPVF